MTEANRNVSAGNVTFSNNAAFSLIAGPCQLESRAHALECAAAIKEITTKLGIATVFKTS
ncbi:MAG: 3-deoxy-8-phosphooctulonate synthase, partial [Roseibium sp.]